MIGSATAPVAGLVMGFGFSSCLQSCILVIIAIDVVAAAVVGAEASRRGEHGQVGVKVAGFAQFGVGDVDALLQRHGRDLPGPDRRTGR